MIGFSTHAAICLVYGIGPIFQMRDLYDGCGLYLEPAL
jgi:hypothetical protein